MATGTGNLPYPGKVYNPFDILTAEELNEDVANIESLADGTGIGDGALSFSTTTGIYGEILANVTLGASSDTISATIAARKFLKVYIYVSPSGGTINGALTFNSDTTNNYSLRRIVDDAAGTATSSPSMQISPNTANAPFGAEVFITNDQSQEKVASWQSTGRGTSGAGNLPSSVYGSGKWVNTANQITTIALNNSGAGDYAAGSQMLVVGSN